MSRTKPKTKRVPDTYTGTIYSTNSQIKVVADPMDLEVTITISATPEPARPEFIGLRPDKCRALAELLLKAAGITDSFRIMCDDVYEDVRENG